MALMCYTSRHPGIRNWMLTQCRTTLALFLSTSYFKVRFSKITQFISTTLMFSPNTRYSSEVATQLARDRSVELCAGRLKEVTIVFRLDLFRPFGKIASNKVLTKFKAIHTAQWSFNSDSLRHLRTSLLERGPFPSYFIYGSLTAWSSSTYYEISDSIAWLFVCLSLIYHAKTIRKETRMNIKMFCVAWKIRVAYPIGGDSLSPQELASTDNQLPS